MHVPLDLKGREALMGELQHYTPLSGSSLDILQELTPPPPTAEAFPHFVMGLFLPLCIAEAIVRHPVLQELH